MRHATRLGGPAYALAVILLLFPLLDLLIQIWPMQLDQAQWRFGSVGIASRMLLTPFLGLFLAFAVAQTLEHYRILQLFTALSTLLLLALIALLGLFALDGLEVRALVTAEALRRFDMTALLAAVKLGLAALVALVYTIGGVRSARTVGRLVRASAAGPGIVASGELRSEPRGT